MSASVLGAGVGAAACLAAAPYLARISLTVPDSDAKQWWRGRKTTRRRLAITAATSVVIGALAGAAAGWTALLPAYLALALAAIPLILIDLKLHRLPNRLVIPTAVAGVLLFLIPAATRHDWHDYLRGIEGGAAVAIVLGLVWLIAPGSFGYGDVKLGGILGGYLGWVGWSHVYYGIFAGFLLGTLVAIVLLIARKAGRKTPIPFGPMLVLGALIVLAFDLVPKLATGS